MASGVAVPVVNVVVPARAAVNFGVVATAGAVTAGHRTSRRIAGTGFPLKSASVRLTTTSWPTQFSDLRPNAVISVFRLLWLRTRPRPLKTSRKRTPFVPSSNSRESNDVMCAVSLYPGSSSSALTQPVRSFDTSMASISDTVKSAHFSSPGAREEPGTRDGHCPSTNWFKRGRADAGASVGAVRRRLCNQVMRSLSRMPRRRGESSTTAGPSLTAIKRSMVRRETSAISAASS
jgi:hypothetical protein